MDALPARLQAVRNMIVTAEVASQRLPGSVQLLAVSKTFPPSAVREAFAAGQRAFGENYVQEGVTKVTELADLQIEWHFIGPIQSNKTRDVAQNFAWVHSLDRDKIAQRLNDQRPVGQPPLQVCIQVNLSGEDSKSGCTLEQLPALAAFVASQRRLRLRGLMTIPEPSADPALQRLPFAQLRQCLQQLNAQGYQLDTLSMGMSADLQAAITEGATIVRIGTAIFGQRA